MGKLNWSGARVNPRGYEQAYPRVRQYSGPGKAAPRPFTGLDDPRVEEWVRLRYGRRVESWKRP